MPGPPDRHTALIGRMGAAVCGITELLASTRCWLERAAAARGRGVLDDAQHAVAQAVSLQPGHPQVMAEFARVCIASGRPAAALPALQRALALRPDDAALHVALGLALHLLGDTATATRAFATATALAPDSAEAWWHHGRLLGLGVDAAGAVEALARAVALAPAHGPIHIAYGDALKADGRIEAAAQAFRAAIALQPDAAHAWWGLANLKTLRFGTGDLAALCAAFETADPDAPDTPALGFALAEAQDHHHRYQDVMATLHRANASRRRQQPWNREAFSAGVEAILAAFASADAATEANGPGSDVIFVVSLPRSGSTLVEQILSAHSQVQGAGEIEDVLAVFDGESRRCAQPFERWCAAATDADWRRLGREYLRRTAPWRQAHARHVDKSLLSWLYVGPIARMLPGARFVHVRRDPLETAFSCYRQWFAQGMAFSYDLADIAAHAADHRRAMAHWSRLYSDRVLGFDYEALQADPDRAIERLLAFCDLPAEPGCRHFHRHARRVDTASAAQVREPLRDDTARAPRYGVRLDPLREALLAAGAWEPATRS